MEIKSRVVDCFQRPDDDPTDETLWGQLGLNRFSRIHMHWDSAYLFSFKPLSEIRSRQIWLVNTTERLTPPLVEQATYSTLYNYFIETSEDSC